MREGREGRRLAGREDRSRSAALLPERRVAGKLRRDAMDKKVVMRYNPPMRLGSSSLKSPVIDSSANTEPEGETPYSDDTVRDQAHFRYALRKFLRFSENAARRSGVTPQQHQLMLGVAGFTGRGSATVSELAEFLQERPHSVVGLIERAVQHGLVRRAQDEADRRVVNVSLTAEGKKILAGLMGLHREAASAFRFSGLSWPRLRRGPEGDRGDRRRAQLDLTTKPDVLRENKGNVRIK